MKDSVRKDVAGIDLVIGDKVAFCQVGYSQLKVGHIVKFSPKGATISYGQHKRDQINRAFSQIAKVECEAESCSEVSDVRIERGKEIIRGLPGLPDWVAA